MDKSISHIRTLLSSIPDPEIPVLTIDDLGVIRKAEWREDELVIVITPTYTGCPAMGQFEDLASKCNHELYSRTIEHHLTNFDLLTN